MAAEPGSDWVLLRGLMREAAHWDDFPERFAQRLPGARVHPVDLAGTGRHWRMDSPWAIGKTMERARADALAQVGEGRPLRLLSISLGGMVAVEWAARHPAELAGAVLINTSLSGISPLHHRLRLGIWPLLARIAMTADTQERERLIFQMTSALDPSAAQIDGRVDIHRRHPVRLGNVVRQLCAAACYHPPLTRPTVPLLLLNSLGDRMVDPACSEALARHWDAPLRSHPWAGHDLPLDDPDWTATTVCAWLDGLASLEP